MGHQRLLSEACLQCCRMMFKLLRCTCLHCFHLKMDQAVLARYRRRLALLLQVGPRTKPVVTVTS